MDSYVKFANSFFGDISQVTAFADLKPQDKEEVLVALSIMMADLQYADNARVTFTYGGTHNWKKHVAKQSCCGQVDSVVRCRSGRQYFIGCNFGH